MSARIRTFFTCVCLMSVCGSTTSAMADEVLGRFVGVWNLSTTANPAKWAPEGGKFTGQESTVWALKNRLILIRDLSQPNGRKGLWIATYDEKQNAYPFLGFDSMGLMGAQWRLTWNAASNSTVGRATDLPDGWTSGGKNQFPDHDTNLVSVWIKDENGDLLMDHDGKKSRRPDADASAIVAAWTETEPAADRPKELDVLDRMIGTWDTVSIQKPAEWTPDGGRGTATVKRQWILNGRFVMDTSMHSDGQESLALISFDPAAKAYRSWWFNSEGHRNESRGTWDDAAQTMSYQTDLEDGKSMRSSVRFADKDREVWASKVTDAEGKVYFDMDIVATRRAATAGQDAKSTDQTRLQGVWGAVTYLQEGQGEGEAPIAPEDSAIRFVFKGDQFTLLASGNAGEAPKGSYKLGSSGKAKTIDLIFPSKANVTKGQTLSGIYEFDGEMLKICYGPDGIRRPSEFRSNAGSKHVMIVFKRIRE